MLEACSARSEITALLAAEDIPVAVQEYVGDPNADETPVERLKIGEIALLAQPTSDGLAIFVEDDAAELPEVDQGETLVRLWGKELGGYVLEAVEKSPHLPLLATLHAARSLRAGFGPSCMPLLDDVQAAAAFSVETMYEAANANRAVILAAADPRLEDFVELNAAILRSTQLPLQLARLHFNQLIGGVGLNVRRLPELVIGDSQPAKPLSIRYDLTDRKVVLTQPLSKWEEVKMSDNPRDPRTGCPVSFHPKLVVAYYQKIAQQKIDQDIWEQLPIEPLASHGIM
jgi:hypothetical protein